MQPRVGVSLPSARRSWYVRLFGGDAGVDPYTRVVSDVYQDLFGEGSFIGKGIYDVDAFEQSCGNFPENAVLSHDLLESAHARSALISDLLLYEEFPARYPADVSRRHRWIRGDWQIAWWLLPWVPQSAAGRGRNPISALSWWKIFDNLRRSVVPIAMLALLLGAWLFARPPLSGAATLFVLAVVGAVPLLAVLAELFHKPADLPLFLHLRAAAGSLGDKIAQYLFTLVFLPYDAYVSLDAILRTLVRVLLTKKKLLEWKTASDAERTAGGNLSGFIRSMWFPPLVSVSATGLLMALWPERLPIAGALLVLWFLSPGVAWWLSRELAPAPIGLTDEQRLFLHKLARRTWRFFEVCVAAEENWLAPDNVQENPARVVASRTSPTNIGVALLADLAASDFGYCTAGRLLERLQKTFGTLARLDRYAGHFYNWYDTRAMRPLPPLYVSTVDSGNLAASLLVLRSGLLELIETRVLPGRMFGGLRDTLRVLLDEARGQHATGTSRRIALVPAGILHKIERLHQDLPDRPHTLSAATALLTRLVSAASEITAAVATTGASEELRWWAGAFERSCIEHRDDLLHLASWAELPPLPEDVWRSGSPEQMQRLSRLKALLVVLDGVPTLRELAEWQTVLLPPLDAVLDALAGSADGQGDDRTRAADRFGRLRQAIADSSQYAAERIRALERLAEECRGFAEMDFSFLFDQSRNLFAIGYNVSSRRRDESFYDLLASEARLASFIAIAQGKVGQEHWFALGRMLTTTGARRPS